MLPVRFTEEEGAQVGRASLNSQACINASDELCRPLQSSAALRRAYSACEGLAALAVLQQQAQFSVDELLGHNLRSPLVLGSRVTDAGQKADSLVKKRKCLWSAILRAHMALGIQALLKEALAPH